MPGRNSIFRPLKNALLGRSFDGTVTRNGRIPAGVELGSKVQIKNLSRNHILNYTKSYKVLKNLIGFNCFSPRHLSQPPYQPKILSVLKQRMLGEKPETKLKNTCRVRHEGAGKFYFPSYLAFHVHFLHKKEFELLF